MDTKKLVGATTSGDTHCKQREERRIVETFKGSCWQGHSYCMVHMCKEEVPELSIWLTSGLSFVLFFRTSTRRR